MAPKPSNILSNDLPPELAARDGEEVEVVGRYEASHLGRYQTIGPDGPSPWLCAVVLPGNVWLRLGGRADAEREAMLGRSVRARGRLIASPARAPAHVAQMDPAPTLATATVAPDGELPLFDPIPPDIAGERRVVEVLTTNLTMARDPGRDPGPPPDGVRITRAEPPGVRFYRYLYDAVGAPWHWYDRKRKSDAVLAAIVDDPRVEIHVAYRRGTPVGYLELDRREPGECELAYFGLVPEAIGGGLGSWFLRWGIREGWRAEGLGRLWVHTCSLDHPSALAVYQKAGFHISGHDRHRQYIVAR